MNLVNGIANALFDLLCGPVRWFGPLPTLVLVSGVFGVLALIAFKHLSFQKRIKATKDRIKAHLIEIRIYQDDLAIVGKAILKVLGRNLQYLALNLVPIVPLALPFGLVAAQLVTRFGFAPVPVAGPAVAGATHLAGSGTTLRIQLAPGSEARVAELRVTYPPGVEAVSPLVRDPFAGEAWQEIVARAPGEHAIEIALGAEKEAKLLAAGTQPARLQPERGRGFWSALLWPAERSFGSDSGFERVSFEYPAREIAWLPAGPGGVLLVFLLSSMLFGALLMKPLKVQV